MKLSSITIRRAVKVNLGNYENTDFVVELSATLDDHLTFEEQRRALSARVADAIEDELTTFFASREAKETKAAKTRARNKVTRYTSTIDYSYD